MFEANARHMMGIVYISALGGAVVVSGYPMPGIAAILCAIFMAHLSCFPKARAFNMTRLGIGSLGIGLMVAPITFAAFQG